MFLRDAELGTDNVWSQVNRTLQSLFGTERMFKRKGRY